MQTSKCGNYRSEGSCLFEKRTDEFGRESFVLVFRCDRLKTISALIRAYLNSDSE